MEKEVNNSGDKRQIRFVRKPAKQGEYYSFFIPKVYIDNGLVDPQKKYIVLIRPVDETAEETGDDSNDSNGDNGG